MLLGLSWTLPDRSQVINTNQVFVKFWVRGPCTEPIGQIVHYLLTGVQYLANQLSSQANQLLIQQRIGARVQYLVNQLLIQQRIGTSGQYLPSQLFIQQRIGYIVQ